MTFFIFDPPLMSGKQSQSVLAISLCRLFHAMLWCSTLVVSHGCKTTWMRDVHAKKVSEVRSDAGTHEKAIVFRDSRFRGVPAGQSVNFPSHGPVSVSSGTGIREAKKKNQFHFFRSCHTMLSLLMALCSPRGTLRLLRLNAGPTYVRR